MNNKKFISIHISAHDPNICVYSEQDGKFFSIELERLFGIRYMEQGIHSNYREFVFKYLKNILCNIGFDDNFDEIFLVKENNTPPNFGNDVEELKKYFKFKNISIFDHHESHAATAFYSSDFDEALVVSFDGMGNDGNFAVFEADLKLGIKKINKFTIIPIAMFYSFVGCHINDVSKNTFNKSSVHCAMAGKLMGLSAYGKYDEKMYLKFYEYLSNSKTIDNFSFNDVENFLFIGLRNILNIDDSHIFSHQEQLNLAYNIQLALEDYFIDLFKTFFNPKNHKNVCLSGGGALNVLLNERLSKMYPDTNFYVPPCPNDCGLSIGALSLGLKKKVKSEIMYSGIPILDEEILPNILMYRGWEEATPQLIAKEIYDGKIIGICRNGSEVGPRALGNRSILANPLLFNIKDDLNKKVKFREWFRPFAPICIEEEADKYFEISKNVSYKYMSFAPKVKEQHRMYLPSITHVDGTSRLQTINRDQNEYIYDILKEFEKLSGYPILVNTSFNIKGKPILTHYQAALQNLDSTQMDGVVLDKYYIKKEL